MKQQNDSLERIQQWVRGHFPLAQEQQVGPDDPLLDSGIIDSLGTLEVVQFLEEQFGIQVSDEEMVADHFDTINAMAEYVQSKQCQLAVSAEGR